MIKVLIVEDDPMVREINEKFLKRVEGYKLCDSVGSIERAKEVILQDKPDLILLDVFFPQGKGLELLKWTRKKDLKIDVILITADRNMESVEEAFRYGAVDYIVKPFIFERFKEAMLQYRNRKKNLEANESINQEIIDKYVLNEKKTNSNLLEEIGDVKGFSQYTYEKVIDYIEGMKGKTFTALQVAKCIGVSRITARRYLDLLEKEQKIILELEYGKVGRPQNKYRLKEE
ncbi:response regulator [Proteiniborus sp. MB09-C3]|uniref:response regulator n=1 Tax=Proteiniborus sp. MB09-C3 TaxID=3050072 RepID=UPI00255550D7|nr:response regulator [Proteiniborus sp. MB09-C3]WIV13391.1 response regulator [Proteiniborus sp. MB09-C3]